MTQEYADAVAAIVAAGVEPTPALVEEYLSLANNVSTTRPKLTFNREKAMATLKADTEKARSIPLSERRPLTGFPQKSAPLNDATFETRSGLSGLGADANIKILPFVPPLPIWAWLLIAFIVYMGIKKLKR